MLRKSHVRNAGKVTSVAVIGLITALAYLTGAFRPIDTVIGDLRMQLSPIDVSGEVVVIAIDNKSLKDIGLWPWPRDIHASLLDRMTDAGARDVFYDIDFAFASEPASDQRFVDALDRAGGSTYLAAFSQRQSVSADPASGRSYNLPHEPFRDLSWPVLVNVPSDRDGLVRRYFFSDMVNGEDLPSAGAFLSGVFGPPGGLFTINYALRPETVPTYSAIDVLNGAVPDAAFQNKSVVIGAFALELRDNFAVPVHGIIPGAVIHVLATETLALGIIPRFLSGFVSIAVLLAAITLFQIKGRTLGPWMLMGQSVMVIGVTESAGVYLFSVHSIQAATGALYPGLLMYGLWWLGQNLDVSQWLVRKTRADIINTKRVLEQVFNDSSDMIVVVDETGLVLNSSRSADFLTKGRHSGSKRLPAELEHAALEAIEANRHGNWGQESFRETRFEDRTLQYTITPSSLEIAQRGRNGPSINKAIATVAARDITLLRQKEDRLIYLSDHDERTGALRRNAFLRCLQEHIEVGNGAAIFAVGLHRFKTINVTFGRDVGDRVLEKVVARLSAPEAGLSPVVRLGGDRFAVFSLADAEAESPPETAERIKRMIAAPYILGETNAQIGARVGFVSETDAKPDAAGELLDYAEEALDEAQQFGGTRIQEHQPEQVSRKIRARAIEREMWTALEAEEFNLVYQPQVNMIDGTLIGVEALIRWTSPTLGQIFPDEFIDIAESNGLIQDIGRWVLGKAAKDAMQLPSDVSVAVNISASQMLDADIIDDVQTALRNSGLPARRLCLELTESVFMSPSHSVLEVMRDLQMLGVSWALDDFGTGYSSLAYLSTLPLRKLKLDKCFIQALGEDADALAIVRSVSKLCEGMSIELICEGVETEEHVRILLAEHCTEAQGYHYGRPQPLADVLEAFSSATQSAQVAKIR